ncbi:flippase [Chitinophaga barathri]|uniref:Flippase n=1 Tax=Chitinophaga barathri TaxID=1647451 RepID=A0A3N4M973_9BACT|nr:flippase [Chitinophaga barathri]RPD38146.1 flippase [Chitinophaga barathri]
MSDQKYTYWLRSGIYSGLQKAAVLLFGVGSILILTRTLSKSDMGTWNLFLVYTAIIEVIRHSLIKNAVIKYLNTTGKEAHTHIHSASFTLNAITTLSLALLIILFIAPVSNFLNAPSLAEVMYYFLPGLLLLIPFSHFEWVQNANADFKGIFWAYLTRQGVSFGLIIISLVLHLHITLIMLVLYYNAGILCGAFVSGYFAKKFLTGHLKIDMAWTKKLWMFGRYVFGTNISASVFRNTDQFVISSYLSTASVALYGVCLRISNLVDVPSQVLADILFPKSAQMMEAGNMEKVRFYYEKAVGAVLAIGVPVSIFILLLPKLVLFIIAGPAYEEAAPILQITILYGLFLPFIKQFGTIMDSIGLPKTNFAVTTITAICNIFICWGFTRRFGLMGAAYGTMTSYGICFIITQVILYKKIGSSLSNTFRHMILFYPDIMSVLQHKILLKWKAR